jgi:uncharacterized protein (DUF305 family)
MDLARWGTRRRLVAGTVALLAVAAAVAVLGSASDQRARTAGGEVGKSTSSPVPVIVPGRPGESASVISSDKLPAGNGAGYNIFDVSFIRMMIPHHAQAVEMAALAPTRARNPQILAIADRIKAAQVPEIARLRGWLKNRDLPDTDDRHPTHGTMRGMQSADAMRGLAAARGDAFDRLFVTMMIDHHQGAIDMATDLLKVGVDVEVGEIATGIAAEQAAEIGRIRDAART